MQDQVKSFFSILLKLLLLLVSRFVSNRHHTNPVGTEWRWKMDPAEKILQDSLEKHQNMIRQFRGNRSSRFWVKLGVRNAVWTSRKRSQQFQTPPLFIMQTLPPLLFTAHDLS